MSTLNSGDLSLNAISNGDYGGLLFRPADTGTEDWGLTPAGQTAGRNLVLRRNGSSTVATFNTDLSVAFAGKLSSAYTAPATMNDGTLATMQAVRKLLSYVTPEMFGAVGGDSSKGSINRTAFTNMFALLATAGCKTAILSRTDSYTISGSDQIAIPDNVSLKSLCDYAGTDGGNLPQIYFADGGGFYASQGVSFAGLRLSSGNTNSTIPLIEAKGQIGLFSVRMDYAQYGLRASRQVVLAYSSVSLNSQVSPASGLQNGTYLSKAFTGTGASGALSQSAARVDVTVSNGAISAISFSVAGACDLPCFMLGFAAGALYSGSPAITNAGQAFLSPMGRSRLHEVWCIGIKKTAIEIDGALDFCHANNVHLWDPTGITGGSVGFRIGHADGLGLIGCKVFAYNNPCLWDKPPNGSNSFASVIGLEVDYSNVGHIIRGPMKIDLTGGYEQCIGRCVSISNPLTIVKVSKNLLSQADHHIAASDFQLLTVDGCNFERSSQNTGLFNVVVQNNLGKGIFCVGDNAADGNSPFLFGSGAVEGAVTTNAWSRKYPAADGSGNTYNGYVNVGGVTDSSKVQVLPLRRFQYSGTTDSNGRINIPHLMGSPGPNGCSVEMNGAAANAGWRSAVVSVDSTNITVGSFNANGSALGSGATVTMYVLL